MSITIKENQRIVTVKTINGNSIHFRYIVGTKTFDDVLTALYDKLKFNPGFQLEKADLVCDKIQYSEIRHLLDTRDRTGVLDNCKDVKIVNKNDWNRKNAPEPRSCNRSCCTNYKGRQCSENNHFILIKTLTGKILYLPKCGHDNLVEDIKEHIAYTEHIPVKEQRLVYGGKLLEDEKPLIDYNIEKGSWIQLVLRLRGGMFYETSGKNGAYLPLEENTFYDLNMDEIIEIDES